MKAKSGDKMEKPKDRKGSLIRLGKYLLRYRAGFILAFVMNLGGNLLALAGPYLSGKAVDAIRPGNVDFGTVFYFAGWMVVCYVCSAILSLFLQYWMITLSRKVVYQMRQDVFGHLLTLPAGYFDTRQTGDILSRISYDIGTINSSLS